MPIKSNNKKGNPYHDESTGEFTSSDSTNSSQQEELDVFGEKGDIISGVNAIKFKAGVDVEGLKKQIEELKKEPSLVDVEKAGNAIIGSNFNVVGYSSTTSPDVAKQYNEALKIVFDAFPEIFKNGFVISYGTEAKYTHTNEDRKKIFEGLFEKESVKSNFSQESIDYLKSFGFDRLSQTLDKRYINRQTMDDHTGGMDIIHGIRVGDGRQYLLSAVKFNDGLSSNPKKVVNYVESGMLFGHFLKFSSKKGPVYLGCHELGHAVDFSLRLFMTDEEKSTRSSLIREGNKSYRQWDTLGIGISFMNNGSQPISGYAATDGDEQVAEAFANYFVGENVTEHNKNIVNLYLNVYKRVFGS